MRDVDVFDLQVVIDYKHQDSANRVHALEHRMVPTLLEYQPYLVDETTAERVGLRKYPHLPILGHRREECFRILLRGIVVSGIGLQGDDPADPPGVLEAAQRVG